MYAEYTGIVISEEGYISSDAFNQILTDIKAHLNSDDNTEHKLYSIGEWFLKLHKNDETNLQYIKKMAGDNWKSVRFKNVVRLGADIEKSGLDTLPRATLVGALLYQKEKRN